MTPFVRIFSLSLVGVVGVGVGCTAPTSPALKKTAASEAVDVVNGSSFVADSSKKRGTKTVDQLMQKRGATLKRMARAGDVVVPARPTTFSGEAPPHVTATGASSAPLRSPKSPGVADKKLMRVAFDEDKISTRAIQVALMARELAPYWHPDVAGRKPVRLALTPALPKGKIGAHPTLKLLGEPIVVVDPKSKPHVEIKSIDVDASPNGVMRVKVALEIPVEGVVATSVLVGEGPRWRVESMDVAER